MKTAFFYDTLCGMIYRCMFAGVDECGHAQWVSITPGEESKTLQDVVIDEELQGYRFILICMDDEPAQPEIIFKVLCKATVCSIANLGNEMASSIRRMKQIGLSWTKEPLELEFNVFENKENSRRKGKYTFVVQDKKDAWNILAEFDAFDNLEELFHWIRDFFIVLDLTAEIPILTKDLTITDDLRKHVRKNYMGMFSSVQKEVDYSIDNDKEEN